MLKRTTALLLLCLLFIPAMASAAQVKVGAKAFPESYILAEIAVQTIEGNFPKSRAKRTLETNSSMMIFNALKSGEVDLYPEYTGTLSEQLLGRPDLVSIDQLRDAIAPLGLVISDPLGFDNSYAIAVPQALAEELDIDKISDLRRHPNLIAGFSYPFIRRSDGFHALSRAYGLEMKDVRAMEHALTYGAIENGSIQITDIYTTDAQLKKLDLRILEDDRQFFPKYYGVYLANAKFVEQNPYMWEAVRSLAGRFSQEEMIRLNAMVDLEDLSIPSVAASFLGDGTQRSSSRGFIDSSQFLRRTVEHLYLVTISLIASILVGIPLGMLATRSRTIGQIILGIIGIIQTIPSLALLCFMIPLIGIGMIPALVALFLYGLLPIVRNTYTGIKSVNRNLVEIGRVLGLSPYRRVVWIELPIASPSILAGIKTSAVINVGTATLAAFIGAGGYGSFIVTGLALNSIPTILEGAVPAAALALLFQGAFELLDRLVIPRGVRLQSLS